MYPKQKLSLTLNQSAIHDMNKQYLFLGVLMIVFISLSLLLRHSGRKNFCEQYEKIYRSKFADTIVYLYGTANGMNMRLSNDTEKYLFLPLFDKNTNRYTFSGYAEVGDSITKRANSNEIRLKKIASGSEEYYAIFVQL